MNIMQFQILMSAKNIPTTAGIGRFNGYTVYQDKDGAGVIEGKIRLVDIDKILKGLSPDLRFVKEYKDISKKELTSYALEVVKEDWQTIYDSDSYVKKMEEDWGILVSKTPLEELWLASNTLRCYDAESFSAAINILRG